MRPHCGRRKKLFWFLKSKSFIYRNLLLIRRVKMKRNVFFAGILASALVFGLVVTGCDTETPLQDGGTVHVANDSRAAGVSNVTVVGVGTPVVSVAVSFNGVLNGVAYTVYVREDGKNTIHVLGDTVVSSDRVYTSGTSLSTASDPDKWAGLVSKSLLPLRTRSSATSFKFGIQTIDANGYRSDIVWSSAISVPTGST
jgi:hypothetical protein